MNWYIGQDIVVIKDHRDKVVVEGEVYTIRGIRPSICRCKEYELDIGKNTGHKETYCSKCYGTGESNGIYWLSEKLFQPLDSLSDISELKEIVENPEPLFV